jgi:hypothetical protein
MKSPAKKRAKLHSASQGAKARASRDKPEENSTVEPSNVFAEPASISMTLPADEVTLRNIKETETLIINLPEEE